MANRVVWLQEGRNIVLATRHDCEAGLLKLIVHRCCCCCYYFAVCGSGYRPQSRGSSGYAQAMVVHTPGSLVSVVLLVLVPGSCWCVLLS